MAHDLYRHWATDGTLLYVGISFSAVARLAQHKENAEWFDQIAKVTIHRYEDEAAARRAEARAILKEHPRYNRTRPKADVGDAMEIELFAAEIAPLAERALDKLASDPLLDYGRRMSAAHMLAQLQWRRLVGPTAARNDSESINREKRRRDFLANLAWLVADGADVPLPDRPYRCMCKGALAPVCELSGECIGICSMDQYNRVARQLEAAGAGEDLTITPLPRSHGA